MFNILAEIKGIFNQAQYVACVYIYIYLHIQYGSVFLSPVTGSATLARLISQKYPLKHCKRFNDASVCL